MTGSCRRLLAVVSLIVAASAFLSAQDPISNRAVKTGAWTRSGETGRPVDPIGQPKRFQDLLLDLATAADAARRLVV